MPTSTSEDRGSADLVPILITDDLTELEVVRGLLETSDIATSTSGLEQAQLLGTHLLSGFVGKRLVGARLLVRREDLEIAKELIASIAPIADDQQSSD